MVMGNIDYSIVQRFSKLDNCKCSSLQFLAWLFYRNYLLQGGVTPTDRA